MAERVLRIPGGFQLTVPADASHALDDDGGTLRVRLITEPTTEVLVGRFDFRRDALRSGIRSALEAEVKRFVEEAFAKVAKKPLSGNYRTWEDAKTRLVLCQGLSLHDPDRSEWVIARGIAQAVATEFYLLHWNGPKRYLSDPVVGIFESFELI